DNGNGILDVGETWTYLTSYTLTQADLDNKGGGEIGRASSREREKDQTAPASATDKVPLVYSTALSITKAAAAADGRADTAGDLINYTITVENTGNISLTGVVVTDQVEACDCRTLPGPASGDNGNGILDVGETWTYLTSYTLTQADLDNKGGG